MGFKEIHLYLCIFTNYNGGYMAIVKNPLVSFLEEVAFENHTFLIRSVLIIACVCPLLTY